MSERRYGQWAGNEKGIAEDPSLCIAEVWSKDGWRSYQCTRKRGYSAGADPEVASDGLYCRIHAKKAYRVSC